MIVSNSTLEPHQLDLGRVTDFLTHEKENGASADCLRQRKTHVMGLYNWLSNSKLLTYDDLRIWRQSLAERGFSEVTVSKLHQKC